MFTGLIKDLGTIASITPNSTGKVFVIKTKLTKEIEIDDSVATNGVCLTATRIDAGTFEAQAVHVTLEKSTLGKLKVGDPVNLELALRPMDRMGGHFVQGHVNGTGTYRQIVQRGGNWEITLEVSKDLTKYIINEGSIALDGISLTVAKIEHNMVTVSIIPHTYKVTNMHSKNVGDTVNIEVDMMAKYLENFVRFEGAQKNFERMIREF